MATKTIKGVARRPASQTRVRLLRDGPSKARERWLIYMKEFNKESRRLSGREFPTLGNLGNPSVELLDERAMQRLQFEFYEHMIDIMDPLAKMGFCHSATQAKKGKKSGRQRRKASTSKNLDSLIAHLVTNEYDGYSSLDLWNNLLGDAKNWGLTVREVVPNQRLTWHERDAGASGQLKFSSFITKLSVARDLYNQRRYKRKRI